jgi:hypothetical protein
MPQHPKDELHFWGVGHYQIRDLRTYKAKIAGLIPAGNLKNSSELKSNS